MADVELVIKIPEEEYKCIQLTGHIGNATQVSNAIFNGTLLTKGHGPLIDINELEPDTEWDYYEDDFISYSRNQIKSAKAIVEADTEVEK